MFGMGGRHSESSRVTLWLLPCRTINLWLAELCSPIILVITQTPTPPWLLKDLPEGFLLCRIICWTAPLATRSIKQTYWNHLLRQGSISVIRSQWGLCVLCCEVREKTFWRELSCSLWTQCLLLNCMRWSSTFLKINLCLLKCLFSITNIKQLIKGKILRWPLHICKITIHSCVTAQ